MTTTLERVATAAAAVAERNPGMPLDLGAVRAVRAHGRAIERGVATGFPAGQTPLRLKLEEVRESVAAGAAEIDIVISRAHVLTGNWQALYDEVKAFREACGPAHLKAILA